MVNLEDRYNFHTIEKKWQQFYVDDEFDEKVINEALVLQYWRMKIATDILKQKNYMENRQSSVKLVKAGLVLAEDGRKMSKEKGTTVNPDEIMGAYGVDAFRLYLMFVGPVKQTVRWSEDNLMGCYRFVNKIYFLKNKVSMGLSPTLDDCKYENDIIAEITTKIKQLKFNTVVSSLMSYINILAAKAEIPVKIWENLLKLLSPLAPYIAEEMWHSLGNKTSIREESFPIEKVLLAKPTENKMVVQVSGKFRGTIIVGADLSRQQIEKAALNLAKVKKQIEGQKIKKIIVVPKKIVNIVV